MQSRCVQSPVTGLPFQRAANMIPAHDSPLAALAFDASGTKLATASEKVSLPSPGSWLGVRGGLFSSFTRSSFQMRLHVDQLTEQWQRRRPAGRAARRAAREGLSPDSGAEGVFVTGDRDTGRGDPNAVHSHTLAQCTWSRHRHRLRGRLRRW